MSWYQDVFAMTWREFHIGMSISAPKAFAPDYQAIVEYLDMDYGASLLDIPSKAGYLEKYLPEGTTVTMADPAAGFATVNDKVETVAMEALPYADNSFDHVVSFDALRMFNLVERRDFYKEVFRVLKDGGTFVIADVGRQSPEAYAYEGQISGMSGLGRVMDTVDERDMSTLFGAGFSFVDRQRVRVARSFDDYGSFFDFANNHYSLRHAPEEDRDLLLRNGMQFNKDVNEQYWEWMFYKFVKE